jgi:hypothetical protein
MVKKLKHLSYKAKRSRNIKVILKKKREHLLFFKKKQKRLFIRFIRRKLRTNIKNRELLKHPLIMKYFFSLKH